ncbi:serine/threonine-protein kinase [Candidatus Lokiarchaeum ossiferum]|uniref:serine/threonine-protein kinase n=1 Tax=Candidatus Lokiarchaeum ossiferum TaxID=2951803 RepID=UPI00352BE242
MANQGILKKGEKIQINKNRYTIVKQIGDGGFGEVYEGKNVKTGQKVAVKLFKSAAFTNPAESKMYWERERDITAATGGYPKKHMEYIESYEDKSDRSNPKFYIVLGFVENATTLKAWFNDNLRSAKPLSVEDMIQKIFLPLCDFMYYAQTKGAIHRDFTFNNIMIVQEKKDPLPIVIDWGGGKMFDPVTLTDEPPLIDDMEGSGTVIITPGFFAPEIIMQKPPLPQTDIYMFGAVLFYALTNGYTRVKPTISSDYILHPQDYNMNVSDTLNDVVEKCTQYEPKDRFRTFNEIKEALQQHLDGNISGLNQLPSIESGNSFILRIKNNNAIVQLNPLNMALEDGKNIRIGRELMIESAAWKEAYKGVFRGITRCKANGVDRPREQFFLGYSKAKNIFYIHEGRNSNPTYLNGQQLPAGEWIPIQVNNEISIKSTTVKGIFELISVLDLK